MGGSAKKRDLLFLLMQSPALCLQAEALYPSEFIEGEIAYARYLNSWNLWLPKLEALLAQGIVPQILVDSREPTIALDPALAHRAQDGIRRWCAMRGIPDLSPTLGLETKHCLARLTAVLQNPRPLELSYDQSAAFRSSNPTHLLVTTSPEKRVCGILEKLGLPISAFSMLCFDTNLTRVELEEAGDSFKREYPMKNKDFASVSLVDDRTKALFLGRDLKRAFAGRLHTASLLTEALRELLNLGARLCLDTPRT